MQEKFIVIALNVGGNHNRIFYSGDIVTAGDFVEGHAPQLVEQGFLAPYTAPVQVNDDGGDVDQDPAKTPDGDSGPAITGKPNKKK